MLRATRSFRSGDFSVSYRIGGLLTDVKQLLSTRSQLREGLLDELHGAGIEIVSPTFMNTRPIPDGKVFIPSAPTGASADEEAKKPLESLVFDKAEEAEKVEEVRERFRALGEELEEIEKSFGEASEDAERKRLEARKEQLASERQRLEEALESAAESEDAPEAAQTAPPEEAATGG